MNPTTARTIYNLARDAAMFDAAANYMEAHGWIRGALKSHHGVCTVGAIMEVVHATGGTDVETDRLVEMFMHHTGIPHVPLWNDTQCRSEDEAISRLRDVAHRLRLIARMFPRMGDIGEPKREIEFEPMPATEPVKEPARTPVEEPEKVPA